MVRYLYQDQKGNIWIGTNGNRNGRLDKFDGNTFTNFNEENGLCSNNITVIFQSSDGKIWFGSDRAAICYYENGEIKSFEKSAGISIRTITEDKDGNIWFGGRKGNLWRYDGEKLNDLTQLKTNKRQQLTMYIKNRRNSNKFKCFGSYQSICLSESLVLRNRLLFIY
jgi:ligand-binding sensor domain-containing protein